MRLFAAVLFGMVIPAILSCNSPEKPGTTGISEENVTGDPALDSLNLMIKKDSTNSNAFYLRSRYYIGQGETNLALGDINRAIQLDNQRSEYFITLADIYLAANRVPNCLEALLKARELDPASNDAMLKLAEVYLILKDYENTFKYTGMALDRDRINPVAHFIRGYAYLETGDTSLAVKNFQTAADQDQNYYEAFMQLGILFSIHRDPLAIGYFQTATRIAPNRTEGWYLLGMTYQDQENIPKAIETYHNLLAIAPDFKDALFNLGYVNLVYTSDYAAAIDYFTRAITVDSRYTDAYFNRGYSYELSGDKVNARKDYQKALELLPNYDRAIDGLNRLDH